MNTADSSEMLIPICQNTRVQIPEINNPVRYIMPQLLDFLQVTANQDNYKSFKTTQHCQGRLIKIPAVSWGTHPVNLAGHISG
jgi:hypothetical protein